MDNAQNTIMRSTNKGPVCRRQLALLINDRFWIIFIDRTKQRTKRSTHFYASQELKTASETVYSSVTLGNMQNSKAQYPVKIRLQ
ncbi:fatty acid cis/trans isomerase [Vibrio lentus]|nr:fatty acid cis/trans isomerase [Vibrio lentus]